MNTTENKFYIYAWFYVNTGEVFYIGKGCNNRWKDTVGHRNNYFKSIIKKEKENVSVKKLYENLTENESWDLERKLIHEYWDKGECKANFHEGGRGGNHGNYNESMRQKLREHGKSLVGEKNPMWHHVYTSEQLENISKANKGVSRHFSKEHYEKVKISNAKRYEKMTQEEKMNAISKMLEKWVYAPKPESYLKYNRDRQCPDNFICKLNNEVIYETRYRKDMFKWVRENLGLSKTITAQVLSKTWKPKFNKHKKFETLEIIIEKDKFKGVSTNSDECKNVE